MADGMQTQVTSGLCPGLQSSTAAGRQPSLDEELRCAAGWPINSGTRTRHSHFAPMPMAELTIVPEAQEQTSHDHHHHR